MFARSLARSAGAYRLLGRGVSELRAFLGDASTWSVVILVGVMCVVALIEHRWAIPLRDAVQQSHGEVLAAAWIDAQDRLLSNLEAV